MYTFFLLLDWNFQKISIPKFYSKIGYIMNGVPKSYPNFFNDKQYTLTLTIFFWKNYITYFLGISKAIYTHTTLITTLKLGQALWSRPSPICKELVENFGVHVKGLLPSIKVLLQQRRHPTCKGSSFLGTLTTLCVRCVLSFWNEITAVSILPHLHTG
jgi:hypothetical protein